MKRIKCYGLKKTTEIKLERSLIRKFFDENDVTYSSLGIERASNDENQSVGFKEDKENKSPGVLFDESYSQNWQHSRNFSVKKLTSKVQLPKPRRDVRKKHEKKVLKPKNVNTESAKERFVEPRWSEFEKHEFAIDCMKTSARRNFANQQNDTVAENIVPDLDHSFPRPINSVPFSTSTPRSVLNSSADIFPETYELIEQCLEKSLKDTVLFERSGETPKSSKKSKKQSNGSRQFTTPKSSSYCCTNKQLCVGTTDELLDHNSVKDLVPYDKSKDSHDSSVACNPEVQGEENLSGRRITKEVSYSSSMFSKNSDLNNCSASEPYSKHVFTSTPFVKPKSTDFHLPNPNFVLSPLVTEHQDSLLPSALLLTSRCSSQSSKSKLFTPKTPCSLRTFNFPPNSQNCSSLKSRRKSVITQAHSDTRNTSQTVLSRLLSSSAGDLTSVQSDTEQSDELTKKDLLQLCNQESIGLFEDVYNWKNYKIEKIGEGTYGEVFLISRKKKVSVLKIIPISQSSDGNSYQNFKNVLSEVKISKCLSELRKNKINQTKNFIKMNRVSLVCGAYPSPLIDAWDAFSDEKSSYNARPDIFDDNQLFVILELDYGGKDMSCFVLRNAFEAETILKQITVALAVAEEAFLFEHRDLHMGNILVQRNKSKTVSFKLRGQNIAFESHGLHVTLIDFTLSRLHEDGYVFYYDLASDVSLFNQSGDLQFDIYRKMKEQLKNQWHECSLYSNVLWLNFLSVKLNEFEYSRPSSLKHKEGLIAIQCFKQNLSKANCALECMKNCGLSTNHFRFDHNRGKNSAKNSILVSRNSYLKC